MKKDIVIELEDGKKYIILEEVKYKSNIYYMGMGIKDKGKIVTDEVTFLTSLKTKDNEFYVAKIEDIDLIKELIKLLKKN